MIKNKSLVLHPADCNEKPATQDLIDALQQLKFIGSPLNRENEGYLVGDDFLQLIIFLGCSPSVELTPTEEDKLFCHVSFIQSGDVPELVISKHTNNPRCPSCRKEIGSAAEINEQWQYDKNVQWSCPDCDFRGETKDMDWRHSAGVDGFFIPMA